MPIRRFPDPRHSTPEGIIFLGGDLHSDSLLLAYRQGIFPWPIEGLPLPWFCPPKRAILEFNQLHVSRSLARARKRLLFRFTIDAAFEEVIEGCATTARPGQKGTWITPEILTAYKELHSLGSAHSAEAWDGDTLVGGIYGVDAGGAFSAESMFFRKPYASKLALLHLIDHLSARGLGWMDIQTMTPHMRAMGALLISRDSFLTRLARSLEEARTLFG
jgi:leucyl/phenylalanyl-tRNA---protein transferase